MSRWGKHTGPKCSLLQSDPCPAPSPTAWETSAMRCPHWLTWLWWVSREGYAVPPLVDLIMVSVTWSLLDAAIGSLDHWLTWSSYLLEWLREYQISWVVLIIVTYTYTFCCLPLCLSYIANYSDIIDIIR